MNTVEEIIAKDNIVVSTFHHNEEREWSEYTVDEARELLDHNRNCVNGFRYTIPAWFTDGDYELAWNLREKICGTNRPFPA